MYEFNRKILKNSFRNKYRKIEPFHKGHNLKWNLPPPPPPTRLSPAGRNLGTPPANNPPKPPPPKPPPPAPPPPPDGEPPDGPFDTSKI